MIDATSTRYEYLQYHTRYERYAIKDTTAVVLQHETLEYTYTQGGDHNISKFGPSDVLFRTGILQDQGPVLFIFYRKSKFRYEP